MLNLRILSKRKSENVKIQKIKDEHYIERKNKSFVRERICDRLYYALSFMDKDDKEANRIIYDNLQWLWKTLNLDNIVDYSDGKNSIEFPQNIHNRQVSMLLATIRYTAAGKTKDAYSKLCDFIDNYQQNFREPLNNWELVAIKAMLEGLLPPVEKCIEKDVQEEKNV